MLERIIFLGWGNVLRGDDGLGVELIAALPERPGLKTIACQELTIEQVLDLQHVDAAVFIDASASGPAVALTELSITTRDGASSHDVSAEELLLTYMKVFHSPPPPAFALSIRGYRFAVADGLGRRARHNLAQAVAEATWLLDHASVEDWRKRLRG